MSHSFEKVRALAWASVLAFVAAWSIQSVGAQSLDYTAAEQMFGEPVTTSATGKPQRVSEAPANMTIVTSEQIRRTGANNLPDVLRFVAGLDVRRYGQQTAAVAIRGYNTALNPRVLVLLDGRQVYQDDYGFVSWSLIPVTMTEIRQIEIVRGPAAALYGFNAVSGVINIVTFDPLRDSVNSAFAEVGTQSTAYGEAVATVRASDRAGLRVSTKGFRSTEFEGKEGGAYRTQPRSGMIDADGRIRIDTGLEWDLSASISSAQSDLDADVGVYQPTSIHANSVRSRVSADTKAGLLELDVYRNENRTNGSGDVASLVWRQDVTVVRASDVLKLGSSHVVRFAGEWRDNTISSLQSFNGRLGYTIAAGSAMWDWQVLPSLALTNALRVDTLSLGHRGRQLMIPSMGGIYRDTSLIEPSFNSGAVLKLSDNDTVRLSAARALQLPSLFDFGVGSSSQGFILAGNAGLRPAAVTNFELDYDRALRSLGTTVRVAVFAQRTDTTLGSPFGSGISFLPNGQPLLMARNFGSSREIGGEIDLRGEMAGYRWNASYALASVQDDTPDTVTANAPSISYQRQTPVHAVILGAGKTWGRLDLDGQARWQSHYQDFSFDPQSFTMQSVTVPNYVTVNARIAYRVTDGLTLSATGDQLLQHRQMQTGGLRVERRLLAGIRVQF